MNTINTGYLTIEQIRTRNIPIPIDISDNFIHLLNTNFDAKDPDPVVFYLSLNEKIVSSIFLVPGNLYFKGKTIRWFWGQDFNTDISCRGKGLGTKLISFMLKELAARQIIFGAYAMSPGSKRIWEKCNMINLGRAPRYVLLLKADTLCNKLISAPFLRSIASLFTNSILHLYHAICKHKASRYRDLYKIEEVPGFGPGIDTFFKKNKPPLSINRTSKTLNWKLNYARTTSTKNKEYKAFYIRNKKNGALAGYFITKYGVYNNFAGRGLNDLALESLIDFVFIPNSIPAIHSLIYHFIMHAIATGRDAVEIITSNPFLIQQLKKNLFFHKGGNDLCFMPLEDKDLDDTSWRDIHNWWITTGESDAFFF